MLQASIIVLLFAGPSALDAKTRSTTLAEPAAERGSPAFFSWGDVDGDGRLDLTAVSPGGVLQLLESAGDGRFEDVTERAGLSQVADAALALWADYDADGRLDLFVGARAGASRLFRNEGGVFVDMTEGSGLLCKGSVQSADWLDHDGDGRPDLHVLTAERHELYRGLEGGFFERSELPLAGAASVPGFGGVLAGAARSEAPPVAGSRAEVPQPAPILGAGRVDPRNPAGPFPGDLPPSSGGVATFMGLPSSCSPSLKDQANPSSCLQASTTPTLGKLYPISANLFVAVGGEVGIGTTSPVAKLHVAGTARITDTLMLTPVGDQALDVSTGSIYKGGSLFIHTKGGYANTAVGRDALASLTGGDRNTAIGASALRSNTSGVHNTASGHAALRYNTTGYRNTASGAYALRSNTTGSYNTASGHAALLFNTTGSLNTASGHHALRSNTTGSGNTASGFEALRRNTTGVDNTASGALALSSNTTGFRNTANGLHALRLNTIGVDNTASGCRALYLNTTGSNNIALGNGAGLNLSTGSNNIAIGNSGVAAESDSIRIGTAGTQTRAFIAGIRGVTTGNADAIPVLVDGSGQLGTVSSSRRFKKDIADMGDATERLLALRPVVFHYKEMQTLPNGGEVPLEYGLIAEEVAEVFPELVVFDEDGQPFTVKYHLLSSMLLNELKELREQLEAREGDHARELERLSRELTRLNGLEARLAALESLKAAVGTRSERPIARPLPSPAAVSTGRHGRREGPRVLKGTARRSQGEEVRGAGPAIALPSSQPPRISR